NLECPHLLLTGIEEVQRTVQAMFYIAARLRQTLAEVGITRLVDPRILLRPVGQAFLVDLRSEELGERRANCLLPWRSSSEIDIRVHGEAHTGQHIVLRGDVLAFEPAGLSQPDPRFDSAFVTFGAVVIDDALYPFTPMLAVGHVRQYRGVFDGNRNLIVKAVVHPPLYLLLGELAAVHRHLVWVVDVIALAL